MNEGHIPEQDGEEIYTTVEVGPMETAGRGEHSVGAVVVPTAVRDLEDVVEEPVNIRLRELSADDSVSVTI